MSFASDTNPAGLPPGSPPPPPANSRVAVMDLIASRLTLAGLESKELALTAARHLVFAIAAGLCALFTWALLLAGLVSLIAHAAGWRWDCVALGAAALHLIAAVVFIRLARPSNIDAFPVTRSEFQKDREWIENLHKTHG